VQGSWGCSNVNISAFCQGGGIAAEESKNMIKKVLFFIGALLVLSACSHTVTKKPESKKEGSANLNVPFAMKDNQPVALGEDTLTVMSIADSRCPSDVQCISAGEVKVEFALIRGDIGMGVTELILPSKQEGTIGSYVVKLIDIGPYPRESQVIKQDDYQIQVVISQSVQDGASLSNVPVQPVQEDVKTQQISAVLKTTKGDITVELFPDRAPITVANFLKLAGENFYDGVKFHRVIPDFMIQTGDPNSKDDDWSDDGTGGPGYTFADEVSPADQLVKGTVAMANSGPNTNGSQFFIVTAESTPWLNGKHTIFGRVTEGIEVVEAILRVEKDAKDHPLKDVVIEDVVIK